MIGFTIWTPVIGSWIDAATVKAEAAGLDGNAVTLAAGQATLGKILFFPLILILAFGILFAIRKKFTSGASNA